MSFKDRARYVLKNIPVFAPGLKRSRDWVEGKDPHGGAVAGVYYFLLIAGGLIFLYQLLLWQPWYNLGLVIFLAVIVTNAADVLGLLPPDHRNKLYKLEEISKGVPVSNPKPDQFDGLPTGGHIRIKDGDKLKRIVYRDNQFHDVSHQYPEAEKT